jgi:hypothetical protein
MAIVPSLPPKSVNVFLPDDGKTTTALHPVKYDAGLILVYDFRRTGPVLRPCHLRSFVL